MKRFEDFLLPVHYQSMRRPESITKRTVRELRSELAFFSETIVRMGAATENLPSFLLAPFWARIRWMGAHAPLLSFVMEHPRIVDWLDRSLEIPAIRDTLPDRKETVDSYLERFVYKEAVS